MESKKTTTLHGLLETIKEYWHVLLKKWWLIGIITLTGGIWAYVTVKKEKPQFYAVQTFMVKESQAGGSMFTNILGQFGLSGSRGNGEYNLDKLVEIAHSQKIVHKALFTEVDIDQEKEVLINRLLEVFEISVDWEDSNRSEGTKAFSMKREYSRFENSQVKQAHLLVAGDMHQVGCMSIIYNDKSGIIKLESATPDEQLSMALTTTLYDCLSEFYIRQAREKQEITLNKLELKADSLNKVLSAKELEVAKLNDRRYGIILQQDQVRKARLNSEIFLLNAMYSEVIKNVENASFNLKNSTPVFQKIDSPAFPLAKAQHSTIKETFKGLLIAGLLALALVIGWHILVKKWQDERKELNKNREY